MKTWMKWAIGVVVVLIIAGAAAGGDKKVDGKGSSAKATTSEPSAKTQSSSDEQPAATKADDGCGYKATDDCTPHVTGHGKVQVDTIQYRVSSATAAKSIGDQTYGLGEKADGRFVSVNVSARNGKDESVTLTDVFKLDINGKTYEPDNDGTVAAMGSGGDEPFFLKDIGPDVTARGLVVFDVPPSAIGKKMELRLGELGFGSTHGYVALPSLSR